MSPQPELSVSQECIASRGQRRVSLHAWRPTGVRAVVAFVSEPGSDGARYDGIARRLALRGIASYAIRLDERDGSSISRGGARRTARDLADVGTMTACLRERHPARPLFVAGHGAGALAVCRHARRDPAGLDGLIAEAVMLDPPWRASLFRRWPRLGLVVRAPRMALVRADRRLQGLIEGLSLPLLLLHGSEDTMAPLSASEYLHRYAGSPDRTLQVFEGGGHDLINGRGRAPVHGKIGEWIDVQLACGIRRHIGIEYINA